MSERPFFDARLYSGNEGTEALKADLRALVTEQAPGQFHERVVPYELTFDYKGNPVGFELDRSSPVARLESLAVQRIFEMWTGGVGKMVWISPPTERYSESRFVLMDRKKDGGVGFNCVAICGKQTRAECLVMADVLGQKVDDVDQLRAQPIEIFDWQQVLELLKMPRVTDVVSRRRLNAYDDRVDLLECVYGEVHALVRRVGPKTSYWDAVRVGARVEEVLASVGLGLSAVGACGASNRTLLAGMAGPFEAVFSLSPKVSVLSSGEAYFSCPNCGKKILSGRGITVCPHCGARKEDCRVQCG